MSSAHHNNQAIAPAALVPTGPSRILQLGSFILPILKCAVCPACLSLLGGAFAGARLGVLGDEQLHEVIVAIALIADALVLGLAFRHHRAAGPLTVCGIGAMLVVAGHLQHANHVEVAGFLVLIIAAFWNWRVLRRHHRQNHSTCTHCNHAGDTVKPLSSTNG